MGDHLSTVVFDVHRPPLLFGFEHDGRFDHVERRRVSRRLSAADFAEDSSDFRKGPDDLVGLLEDLARLRRPNAGKRGGHVEQVPFIKRGHEFGTEILKGKELADPEGPLAGPAPGAEPRGPPAPRTKNPK